MMDTDTLSLLAKYNAWADRVLFTAMKALPEGAIYQKTSTLFGSMVGTLNHNYQVDLIWQAHLTGQQHGFTSRRDVLHPRFEDLVSAQAEADFWFTNWAKQQTSETLSETLQFKFTSGQPVQMQRGSMFLHVVNHKTYHRGWASQMFFDFGATPPETDLSIYLTDGVASNHDAAA
ncbi:MAG TPA: DinB family protein [Rhodanobacter sp.]